MVRFYGKLGLVAAIIVVVLSIHLANAVEPPPTNVSVRVVPDIVWAPPPVIVFSNPCHDRALCYRKGKNLCKWKTGSSFTPGAQFMPGRGCTVMCLGDTDYRQIPCVYEMQYTPDEIKGIWDSTDPFDTKWPIVR